MIDSPKFNDFKIRLKILHLAQSIPAVDEMTEFMTNSRGIASSHELLYRTHF